MKKLTTLALLGLVVALGAATAESDTWLKPGRLTAEVGIGTGWHSFGQIAGGLDLGLVQVPFAPNFPVDFGLGGRAAIGTGGIGVGAYGTAHYSWKAARSGNAFVDGLEMYFGLGLGVMPTFGLDGYGGLAYHFDKSWAVIVEATGFSGILGVSYRIN